MEWLFLYYLVTATSKPTSNKKLPPQPADEAIPEVQVDAGDLAANNHRKVEAIARHGLREANEAVVLVLLGSGNLAVHQQKL